MVQLQRLLLGTALAASLATAAQAEVTFTLGDTGGIGEINVLFETPQTGLIITGEVDHSGIPVQFLSLTGQSLQQTAQGNADIFDASGALLTSIDMSSPGFGYGDAIINLQSGTGPAVVTVTDNLSQVFTYLLGPGENFLTIQVIPGSGEEITDINVQMGAADAGFLDFKQPRVSDVCALVPGTDLCTPVVIPTPEPASMALLGVGLLGLGFIVHRRRSLVR